MASSGSSGLPLQLNPWEDHALEVSSPRGPMRTKPNIDSLCNQYEFPAQTTTRGESNSSSAPTWIQLPDPIIYPGVYSASGIDVMGILVRIASSRLLFIAFLYECHVPGYVLSGL